MMSGEPFFALLQRELHFNPKLDLDITPPPRTGLRVLFSGIFPRRSGKGWGGWGWGLGWVSIANSNSVLLSVCVCVCVSVYAILVGGSNFLQFRTPKRFQDVEFGKTFFDAHLIKAPQLHPTSSQGLQNWLGDNPNPRPSPTYFSKTDLVI